MSEVERLEKLRGHFVKARRQEVSKVLRSKSPSVVAVRRLKATQDITDALDRAIVDETRLHPPPVQQPEIGTAGPPDARPTAPTRCSISRCDFS
jgi:hypothetical protein